MTWGVWMNWRTTGNTRELRVSSRPTTTLKPSSPSWPERSTQKVRETLQFQSCVWQKNLDISGLLLCLALPGRAFNVLLPSERIREGFLSALASERELVVFYGAWEILIKHSCLVQSSYLPGSTKHNCFRVFFSTKHNWLLSAALFHFISLTASWSWSTLLLKWFSFSSLREDPDYRRQHCKLHQCSSHL